MYPIVTHAFNFVGQGRDRASSWPATATRRTDASDATRADQARRLRDPGRRRAGRGRSRRERLSVRRIAADQDIPVRFLPRVMADLVAAGIVEGRPGRTGGYRLARPASGISMLEVIEAVEGDSRRRTCVLRGGACRLTTPARSTRSSRRRRTRSSARSATRRSGVSARADGPKGWSAKRAGELRRNPHVWRCSDVTWTPVASGSGASSLSLAMSRPS